jgi:hypothetical protein
VCATVPVLCGRLYLYSFVYATVFPRLHNCTCLVYATVLPRLHNCTCLVCATVLARVCNCTCVSYVTVLALRGTQIYMWTGVRARCMVASLRHVWVSSIWSGYCVRASVVVLADGTKKRVVLVAAYRWPRTRTGKQRRSCSSTRARGRGVAAYAHGQVATRRTVASPSSLREGWPLGNDTRRD